MRAAAYRLAGRIVPRPARSYPFACVYRGPAVALPDSPGWAARVALAGPRPSILDRARAYLALALVRFSEGAC